MSDPDSVRRVFQVAPGTLEAREGAEIFRPFVGPQSVLLLEGEEHLDVRRRLQAALGPDPLAGFVQTFRDVALAHLASLRVGTTIQLLRVVRAISLESILRCVFGLANPDEIGRFRAALQPLLESRVVALALFPALQRDLGPLSPWGWFVRRLCRFDDLVRTHLGGLRSRMPDGPPSVARTLLASGGGDDETIRAVRDQIVTLLVAGHDTTSSSTAWALYWIHRRPSIRIRLEAELAQTSIGDLARLPFLDAVCRETLRLFPVVPLLARGVRAPFPLDGCEIQPGVMVAPCVYLAHHRQDVYRSPGDFHPERFLEHNYGPHEYFPFGGGRHRCIGMHFGLLEMKVVLGTFLTQARFELVGSEESPVRRAGTLVPRWGVRARLDWRMP